MTLTAKYSTLALKLAPYRENSAAEMVAPPSGLLVGMEMLAVMLPAMLEFSVVRTVGQLVMFLVSTLPSVSCDK